MDDQPSLLDWQPVTLARKRGPETSKAAAPDNDFDVELLRKLLSYDPETGLFVWAPRPVTDFANLRLANSWNGRFAGKSAFTGLSAEGYAVSRIYSQSRKAHRVAWAMHYGKWPDGQIDHINGDRADNRICNLRDVSHIENMRNASMQVTNTSGHAGISWCKITNAWRVRIGVGGRRLGLGTYHCFDTAVRVRRLAERAHGYHPNHGKRPSPAGQARAKVLRMGR